MNSKNKVIPKAVEDFYKEIYFSSQYRCLRLGVYKGLDLYGVEFGEEECSELGFPILAQVNKDGSVTDITGFEALELFSLYYIED